MPADGAVPRGGFRLVERGVGPIQHVRVVPDGRLMHAYILIGGGDGTNLGLHRFVEDVDAAVEQAVASGATLKMPPLDMFWGDRYAQVLDPYGYEWPLATHVKDMTPEEMMAAQAEMMGGGE